MKTTHTFKADLAIDSQRRELQRLTTANEAYKAIKGVIDYFEQLHKVFTENPNEQVSIAMLQGDIEAIVKGHINIALLEEIS